MSVQISGASSAHQFNSEVYNVVVVVVDDDDDYDDDDNDNYDDDCLNSLLKKLCHSSLSRAAFFQFLTPSVFISRCTPCCHHSFGLPVLLTPPDFVLNIFLRVLSLFIHTTCPAHASVM